jgi:hypothetical protein
MVFSTFPAFCVPALFHLLDAVGREQDGCARVLVRGVGVAVEVVVGVVNEVGRQGQKKRTDQN